MHALPAEISGVAGHDSQVVDQGNGGNLLVDGGGNQETDPNMKSSRCLRASGCIRHCASESSSQRMWAQSGSVGPGLACIANGAFHALLADEEIRAFISQPERPMK